MRIGLFDPWLCCRLSTLPVIGFLLLEYLFQPGPAAQFPLDAICSHRFPACGCLPPIQCVRASTAESSDRPAFAGSKRYAIRNPRRSRSIGAQKSGPRDAFADHATRNGTKPFDCKSRWLLREQFCGISRVIDSGLDFQEIFKQRYQAQAMNHRTREIRPERSRIYLRLHAP